MKYTHIKFNEKIISLKQFEKFHVTGVLYNDKRFKTMVYNNFEFANSINLYNGSIWGVKSDKKRVLLKRVYN